MNYFCRYFCLFGAIWKFLQDCEVNVSEIGKIRYMIHVTMYTVK